MKEFCNISPVWDEFCLQNCSLEIPYFTYELQQLSCDNEKSYTALNLKQSTTNKPDLIHVS